MIPILTQSSGRLCDWTELRFDVRFDENCIQDIEQQKQIRRQSGQV